jgi:hypothetical protein
MAGFDVVYEPMGQLPQLVKMFSHWTEVGSSFSILFLVQYQMLHDCDRQV